MLRALERGWSVVPQAADKKALVRWAEYQRRRTTLDEAAEWAKEFPNCRWAVVTGRNSILVLDFDGELGMATMKRLGFKPMVRTPHGGAHVWVTGVPFAVYGGARVDEASFPAMDVRADGQVATFCGEGYRLLTNGRLYPFEELPSKARSLLKVRRKLRRSLQVPPVPDDFSAHTPREVLLGEALSRLSLHPRNETGFWLATQLRDERYSRQAILRTLGQYADLVTGLGDHPYTRQEGYDSAVSALSQPARLPRMLRDGSGLTLLSEVQIEHLSWLWQPRIPMRKVTIIEGDPDRGKTTVTLDIAARISAGTAMPGDEKSDGPGAVLIMCAEDDMADTVKPRLIAAGANEERIGFFKLQKDDQGKVKPLSIPEDVSKIERTLRSLGDRTGLPVKLLVIDPITAYLSEKIHYGNDPQVRQAMLPLKLLAEDTGVACLLVRHLNKDGALRAMYRGGGSIAFNAAARSVLVVERHPEDPAVRVLASVKGNLARATPAMTFQIEADVERDVPKVAWGQTLDLDADALMRASDGRTEAPARREAERFLNEFLADGPKEYHEIEEAAKAAGLTMKTVKNAKDSLRVKARSERDKTGKHRAWLWSLPIYVVGSKFHFDFED